MNSSLSWKNIMHKAECSDFPRKTHHQKNLILTVVASSLTRVSHSDAIFSESLPLTSVFKTMVECRIAKCWQSRRTPARPPSKKKDFGSAIFLSCFTCGLFFHLSLKSLWEYFHLIFKCINKEMEKSNHKDICFVLKKKKTGHKSENPGLGSVRIQSLSYCWILPF